MTVAVHTQAPNETGLFYHCVLYHTVSYRHSMIQYSTHKKAENRTPSADLPPSRTRRVPDRLLRSAEVCDLGENLEVERAGKQAPNKPMLKARF